MCLRLFTYFATTAINCYVALFSMHCTYLGTSAQYNTQSQTQHCGLLYFWLGTHNKWWNDMHYIQPSLCDEQVDVDAVFLFRNFIVVLVSSMKSTII